MNYTTVQVYEDKKPIDHVFNKDEREPEIVSDSIPIDKLAKVKYGMGITINIGNFQSARVDIGVEYPTHVDDIDTEYNRLADYCSTKLGEEMEILSNLKKVVK